MPFVYREVDGLGYYEVSGWPSGCGAFTTRRGGVSRPPFGSLNLGSGSGDDPRAVKENRTRLSGALGFEPGMVKTIKQVHGGDVHVLRDPDVPAPTDGYDAIVTNLVGPAVGVLTADCVPILLYDPIKHAVGAVHAGWAGTVNGIVARAVRTMCDELGSYSKDIRAAIGPSIGPCCYEVDDKVIGPLKQNLKAGNGLINVSRPGHWLLDLWEANSRILLSAGITRDNITVMGVCTSCNTDKFYSHRKSGGTTGRMMALAWLKPR